MNGHDSQGSPRRDRKINAANECAAAMAHTRPGTKALEDTLSTLNGGLSTCGRFLE
jgi:hypothetical protein